MQQKLQDCIGMSLEQGIVMGKPDPIKNPYSDEDYATIKNAWTALSKGYDAVSGLLSQLQGILTVYP